MTKPRIPTGSDVARLAGVSKSAVSRAYNEGFVAPYAKERIFEAARKLHLDQWLHYPNSKPQPADPLSAQLPSPTSA